MTKEQREEILAKGCIPVEIEGKVIALQYNRKSFMEFKETYPGYKVASYAGDDICGTRVFILEKDKKGTLLCTDNFDFFIEINKDFYPFYNLTNFELLDFAYVDTSKMWNMESMFEGHKNLQTLDISSFDTGKVCDMNKMFRHCDNLKILDLSNFDTRRVMNMSYMFAYCESLQTLNLSSFDTSRTERMGWMFKGCQNLKTLDLSNFDTSKLEVMDNMFHGCKNLQTLDISNFDTSNVRDTSYMFEGCQNLRTVVIDREKNPKIMRELRELDHKVEIVEPTQKSKQDAVTISNAFS